MRSRLRRRWLGACAALALAVTAGCGGIQTRDRALRLTDTTNTYAKALRWSEFGAARRFLAKREGEARAVDPGFLANIRVTSSEITGRVMSPNQTEATVELRISYFHVDVRNLVTVTESQIWWYREPSGGWYLDGDLPDFKAGLARRKKR